MSEAVRTMMRMDAEAAQDAATQADAGFLWDFWYPAARSTAIRGQKLVTAMLLEVPLVLGRTSEGKVFAMRDSCPHRGIPLSYGRLDEKARTGGFRFRMGGWMRKWWSAATTDGGLMRAAGSALRFLLCPARTS